MLWLKAFHIIFVVTWFAGLFYLPRLFVYHAAAADASFIATLKVMERRLLKLTHIGGVLAIGFGVALLLTTPAWMHAGWMQAKLVLVLVLVAYHAWCGQLVAQFARDDIRHGQNWFRWFNEFPALILVAVVLLVVLKPF
jgi:protoporphyrinogen IX oxidase